MSDMFKKFLEEPVSVGGAKPESDLSKPRVSQLREALDRYIAPCPFKVGDLVTPRKNSSYRQGGDPHLVIEVFEQPVRNFSTETAQPGFGGKFDMRVICMIEHRVAGRLNHYVCPYTVESWQFEPWESEEKSN